MRVAAAIVLLAVGCSSHEHSPKVCTIAREQTPLFRAKLDALVKAPSCAGLQGLADEADQIGVALRAADDGSIAGVKHMSELGQMFGARGHGCDRDPVGTMAAARQDVDETLGALLGECYHRFEAF